MAEPIRLLRRALPFLSIAVLAALLYDGWIFYSRWKAKRDTEQARQEEEVRRARETIDLMGGTSFRIMNFYASPQVIRRGAKAEICFGVYGAKSVHIDPPVQDLKPAINNCFRVTPTADTTYKLTAEDDSGHTTAATLTVKVAP